ncbi:MAG TPA: inorganic phosphate transporter [Thermoanaerobaculia bacterium]|jgi:inorganic phosphate transporter, PiT family|nr:inorganic phosphate transporter [Thermoanaerobaculia bacterium]HSP95413.1 inorganic phosphate transporter [Thermoanaerobaculia bacterium]
MTYVLVIIAIALTFDFINGMHDSANSIATVVSTRVLTPLMAVIWAAFFNFVAAFTFGTAVAKTIGSGLIDVRVVNSDIVLGGLIGAIVWNLLTWYFGIPSSSSHALIGGYAGAAVAHVGVRAIVPGMAWVKTLSFIVLSPLIGMVFGFAMITAVSWIFRNVPYGSVDRWFRRAQLGSAAAFSLSHGTNDAQKTMGIIAGLLVANRKLFADNASPLHFMYMPDLKEVPIWIILSAHAAIGLGTLTGGWRIVRTMGTRITKLKPFSGFCAETGGAATVILASVWGIPVSTTHTITGSIIGVGATQRFSAVRWGVAERIVYAWILTIPMAGAIGAIAYGIVQGLRT